jgi:hypothetical protein
MKRSVGVLFVFFLAVGSIPIRASAQYLVWHYDRLIENNTGMNGNAPDIAISGLKAVAVWYQSTGSNRRLYANYSIDGGKTARRPDHRGRQLGSVLPSCRPVREYRGRRLESILQRSLPDLRELFRGRRCHLA